MYTVPSCFRYVMSLRALCFEWQRLLPITEQDRMRGRFRFPPRVCGLFCRSPPAAQFSLNETRPLPGAQAGEAWTKHVNIGRGTDDFKGQGAANGSGWFCAQAADDSGHIGRRCRGGRSFRGRGDTLARRQVLGCFGKSRWHFDTSVSSRTGASCWTCLWLPRGHWSLWTGLWGFAPGRLHQHAHVGRSSGRNHGALPDVPYWLCEGK